MPIISLSARSSFKASISLALVLLFTWANGIKAANQEPQVIKHYDQGYSPILRVYLNDLLSLALEKTQEEYGDFDLNYYSGSLSSNRAKLETERGEILNVLFSSHWRGHLVNSEHVIKIDLPVFKGLLGLRQLVIAPGTAPKLDQVWDWPAFSALQPGQGSRWIEIEILEANGIQVIEAQNYQSLYPMLLRERFDYIPLSILEIEEAVQSQLDRYPNLQVNARLNIFYPLPIFLFVNAKEPELAERLAKGIELMMADGSIDRIFALRFSYLDKALAFNSQNLVLLKNPLIDPKMNAELIERFSKEYGHHYQYILRSPALGKPN